MQGMLRLHARARSCPTIPCQLLLNWLLLLLLLPLRSRGSPLLTLQTMQDCGRWNIVRSAFVCSGAVAAAYIYDTAHQPFTGRRLHTPSCERATFEPKHASCFLNSVNLFENLTESAG